jgi:hypothetical protein
MDILLRDTLCNEWCVSSPYHYHMSVSLVPNWHALVTSMSPAIWFPTELQSSLLGESPITGQEAEVSRERPSLLHPSSSFGSSPRHRHRHRHSYYVHCL